MIHKPTPGNIPRQNDNSQRYMHPNIHSSIICSTKDRKQTIPSMDTWVKKINIYTMKYFSAVKLVAEIWSSMDEPGEYHTSLMWNLKKKRNK